MADKRLSLGGHSAEAALGIVNFSTLFAAKPILEESEDEAGLADCAGLPDEPGQDRGPPGRGASHSPTKQVLGLADGAGSRGRRASELPSGTSRAAAHASPRLSVAAPRRAAGAGGAGALEDAAATPSPRRTSPCSRRASTLDGGEPASPTSPPGRSRWAAGGQGGRADRRISAVVSPGSRRKSVRDLHAHEPSRQLRARAQALYAECWQVAACRLAAGHGAPPPRAPGEQRPSAAEGAGGAAGAAGAPRFSGSSAPQGLGALPAGAEQGPAAPAAPGACPRREPPGQARARPPQDAAAVEGPSQHLPQRPSAESMAIKEAFRAAVSDAKLAQAQAAAAARDVENLRAALRKAEAAASKGMAGGDVRSQPRSVPSTGHASLATLETHGTSSELAALSAQRAKLKQQELALMAELQDVERQNRRLAAELERRELRAEAAEAAAGAAPAGAAASGSLPGLALPSPGAATAPSAMPASARAPREPRLLRVGGPPPPLSARGGRGGGPAACELPGIAR